ncbi:MAG: GH3 auxin-responsive promoter family protein [Planctomycetota bacterium]
MRWTAGVGAALDARVALRRIKLADTRYWQQQTARLQLRQLRRILKHAARTEIGRQHEFDRLAAVDDGSLLGAFRSAVPVRDWYDFKDRIARMREGGERDVLWPGLVRDFAQTSGTTAGDKFIPVTNEMFRSNYRASLDIFGHLGRRDARGFDEDLPRIMSGRALFLGGSSDVTENEHGVRTGDLSGLVTRLIRWPLSEVYSPGPDIALESHWPTKIEKMARLVIDQDVRFISGMPSWALVLFERMLELSRERGKPASCVRELWPNLRVFVHGGVRYDPFRARTATAFSGDPETDIPNRFELYPASEGFIALQDIAGDRGLRLLVDIGNFYEFVPVEQAGEDDPETFSAWEVERGQRYVVVMTTCAGLYRYLIGDVVEFDHVPGGLDGSGGDGPARLRIVGRHKHFINAFGENIIVEHIEDAVAQASEATGFTVGEFTAAPVYPGEGRRAGLELAVETSPCPPDYALITRFAEAFDASLKSVNVDYTTKRTDSLGMAPPTVTPIPLGTFHRWLESRGKLGGQHKCPRCANHRETLEAVVASAPLAGTA